MIAKGENMTFKETVPYIITSATMLFGFSHAVGGFNEKEKILSDAKSARKEVVKNPFERFTKDSVNCDFLLEAKKKTSQKVVTAEAQRYDVIYTRENGSKFKRSGGTRAWRNNNPGCLRYSEFSISNGAIGKAGGFAVFPDKKTGEKALSALLKTKSYYNLTISDAIFKYAPPHENDTQTYKNRLKQMTGLPINLKISELTDEQMSHVVNAICIVEGWQAGKETQISAPEKQMNNNMYALAQQKTR